MTQQQTFREVLEQELMADRQAMEKATTLIKKFRAEARTKDQEIADLRARLQRAEAFVNPDVLKGIQGACQNLTTELGETSSAPRPQ